jgi:hypothetical protein
VALMETVLLQTKKPELCCWPTIGAEKPLESWNEKMTAGGRSCRWNRNRLGTLSITSIPTLAILTLFEWMGRCLFGIPAEKTEQWSKANRYGVQSTKHEYGNRWEASVPNDAGLKPCLGAHGVVSCISKHIKSREIYPFL